MSLPDPAIVKTGPPPDGYRWAWTEENTDGPNAWRVVPPDQAQPCRWRAAHLTCGVPSVAKLLRSTPPSNNWWHYCADHLYGRHVHNGVVWTIHAEPSEGETG